MKQKEKNLEINHPLIVNTTDLEYSINKLSEMASRIYLFPTLAVTACCLLFLAQMIVYGLLLPDQIPTHWNDAGQIDAYDSKGSIIGIFTGVFVGLTALLFGLSIALPSFKSGNGVNIPNKDFWLDPNHPERIQFALKLASIWLAYFTAWNQALVIATYEVILEMMRAESDLTLWLFAPIVIYFIGFIGMIIWLYQTLHVDADTERDRLRHL